MLSGDTSSEWFMQLELMSRFSPCRMTLRLLCLFVPVLFYAKIFVPCW